MRIALVSPYDLAAPGGVQAQVLGLATALVENGDAVLVLAPGRVGRHELERGAVLQTVGGVLRLPVNGSQAPVTLVPGAFTRTWRALGEFDPQVVHVHEPFVPGPALAATLYRGPAVVGTFHRAGAGPGYRLVGPLLRQAFVRLDAAVAVSEAARQTLEAVVGAGGPPVGILANGVDLARFSSALPAPSMAPTVVFVGRLERRKGLDLLLGALAASSVALNCWIVGDGPERARLEARFGADRRLRWLGAVDNAEVARRVAGADLFVAPSRSGESFGVVLLEAMAARTAVLAADLPGYRLAAGEAAAYFRAGDGDALRAALEALLAAPQERQRLVALGEARAAGSGFAALAAAYRSRYEAVVADRTARRGAAFRGERPSP